MRPIFFTNNVELTERPRVVGKDHLKLKIRQEGATFDAIGFNLGSKLPLIDSDAAKADILFTIEENSWNGTVFPQLKLKDIRAANHQQTRDEILLQVEQSNWYTLLNSQYGG